MGSIKTIALSVSTDIDTQMEAGWKAYEAAGEAVKRAIASWKDAGTKFGDAQKKADQAIAMAKDLGVDSKVFDMKKANAKNAQAKADKNAGISIIF